MQLLHDCLSGMSGIGLRTTSVVVRLLSEVRPLSSCCLIILSISDQSVMFSTEIFLSFTS